MSVQTPVTLNLQKGFRRSTGHSDWRCEGLMHDALAVLQRSTGRPPTEKFVTLPPRISGHLIEGVW